MIVKIFVICTLIASAHVPRIDAEMDGFAFMDMAANFLHEYNNHQEANPGSGGILEMASLIGNLIQPNGNGKSQPGIGDLLAGIGSMFGAKHGGAGGGGGFDPSIIGHLIENFIGNNDQPKQQQQRSHEPEGPSPLELVLNTVSTFMAMQRESAEPQQQRQTRSTKPNFSGLSVDGFLNMLPHISDLLMPYLGTTIEDLQEKHKEHAGALPPFLEKFHVMWDDFIDSELGMIVYEKLGLKKFFKEFTNEDGTVEFDRLFKSLHDQTFRQKWIQQAIRFGIDWAIYVTDPMVSQQYIAGGQIMANTFLQSKGFPTDSLLDADNLSESISNLITHVMKKYFQMDVSPVEYIGPYIDQIVEFFKLGKNRQLLESLKSDEFINSYTDKFNIQIIEPILRIHRAYKLALNDPACDAYILCELNSFKKDELKEFESFKKVVSRVGSYVAAWFLSIHNNTPFWDLFSTVNKPHNCEMRHSESDCSNYKNAFRLRHKIRHSEL